MREGGPSAGVAVLARSVCGLRAPKAGHVIVQSRAVAAIVEIPGAPSMMCISAYLWHSQGMSKSNVEVLCAIGMCVEKWGSHFNFRS